MRRGRIQERKDAGEEQKLPPPPPLPSTTEVIERIAKMKEERLKKKNDSVSEISAWVNQSRKLEVKMKSEKEKASHRLKVLDEQDNIQERSEDEELMQDSGNLAGVKILHGLDKVIEGGAVVLTLKDQSILANGDINEEIDVLQNVEIGEQKQRDEAYRDAKKKTGIYVDKFADDDGSQKTILPQYDDPKTDEGITLDGSGRISGEAEKKLEELRKRIQGGPAKNHFEDLTSSGKITSDYYTQEEMVQFKKPKKKKSLRKKDKLDLDALEAEAVAAGLGVGDVGSRTKSQRPSAKAEQEKWEAERSNAYQKAYTRAEEASKALRLEQTLTVQQEQDDAPVFGEDYEDLQKSLEQARKLSLRRQDEEAASIPKAVPPVPTVSKELDSAPNPTSGDVQDNKVVITEMEEFVLGLQINEDFRKPDAEDVFKDEEEVPKPMEQEVQDEAGGWTEVNELATDEMVNNVEKEDIKPDETIHEISIGKGLAGVLKLCKDRGALNETVDLGGRNMDKKKSKLVGIFNDEPNKGAKEIHIERTDEFGRIMTPKEAFRKLSHKFHGKGPGKMKVEKQLKKFEEDLKLKQMSSSDTPFHSMERLREMTAQQQSPYIVLDGKFKPGQSSDSMSGFAAAEKTPMSGEEKVQLFMGIKRRSDAGENGLPPKKPKK
ncbi:hypothetical protein QJS10_CPB11g01396 [Acorus calamus]|uniref:Uncharacterized protein n=1 Tax=Acorus calamus TaxID=4465 RepID=A0AAV9DY27_ACOCL|nr:hypothetical protein QJS10_CPB11g01396 [Acorus calamus]